MKKIISIIFLALFAAAGSVAQNMVSISSGQGVPGDVVTIDVVLQNSDDVTAAEVVIPLVNKQLTYVDGSCVIDSERANGHSLSAAVVNGALKIYIYSISLAQLNGNDGKVASFALKLGNVPAEYPLQPQVLLSDAAGKALPVSVDNGVVTVLAPQIEAVTQTVDFGHVPIMSQYTKNFTLRNSGTLPLTVTDIESDDSDFSVAETAFTIPAGATKSVAVAYSPKKRGAVESAVTILSNATNGNASVKLLADPYSVNELHSNRVEGSLGEEVTVELRMNNMEPIVGVQTTFTLPAGIEYVDGSFAPAERASSHTAMASVRDNKLTLILYSLNNTPVSGNDGVVATFRLKLDCKSGNYRFEPQNTVLSNAAVENMMSAVSGDYIVVKSPDLGGENALDFGKTPVTEVAKANYSVRNNGRATLVISSVAFLAEGYRVANELPLSIEPGATSVLNVEYLPTKEGEHSTTMNIYSNDPDENMKTVQLSGTIYEPNNLTFEGENLQNGDYVVSIGLDNYTGIVAMQMDIHWLPGMKTSSDKLKVSERLAGHSCSITKIDEDTYRFIAFSFGNVNFTGNSGKLFDLTFVPDNGVEYKDTPILIDNVVLSSSGANNYTSQMTVDAVAAYSHYYVRFVCEGEVISETFQRAGTPLVLPHMPEREGYTFSGWEGASESMPAFDVEYTGSYNPNKYKIEYIVNGAVFATDSIAYGAEITLRELPTKEGYTFSGWSGAPETMPANDVVINGTFAVNNYNVIYKIDGEEYKIVPVAYGTPFSLIDAPVKEGHTFRGWEGEMQDGIIAYPMDLASNADNMLYSNAYCTDKTWGDEFKGWHVLFDNNPATFFHSEYNSNVKESSDGLEHYIRIDLGTGNEVEKFSFTYSNRQGTSMGSPTKIVVEGCNEANGVYAEIATLAGLPTYNSTYSSDTLGNGNKYRFIRLRVTETSSNQSPSGHPYFYISELGLTKYVERFSIPKVMPAEDVVINGTYTVNSYNVTYKVDGEEFASDSIAFGSKITLREEPTKEGYTFSGWSEAPATMPAKDVTIEGTFAVNSYVVKYIVDGEEFASDSIAFGSEITLREQPTKEGYTFSGWSEAPETMPANGITIVGSFTVNRYTITYIVDDEEYRVENVAYGSEIIVPESPVKEGYTFGGWHDVPATMPAEDIVITSSFVINGYKVTYKIDGVEYQSELLEYGSVINLPKTPLKDGYSFSGWMNVPDTMPASDITIEGTFTVNYYAVTYIVDGEEFASDSIAFGSEIVLREQPTKEGYTFSGWSEAPETMPAEDVTIEGVFTVNSYAVKYIVDGEEFATDSIAFGTEIVLREQPTKEGYTFSGWSEAPETMPAEDIVIEGTFTLSDMGVDDILEDKDGLPIIFDLNGHRIIDVRNIKKGIYIINGKKVIVR